VQTQDSRSTGSPAYVFGVGPSIGGACARALAAAGCAVACIDVNAEAARDAAQAASAIGVPSTAIEADVTQRAQVRAAVMEAVSRLGPPRTMVNVVGGSLWSLAAETSDDEWDRSFQLNLRQQWLVAQEVLPPMREAGGGSIVAIASVSGLTASTNHGGYGAAKAGLISLVRTLAVENAGAGIRVNAVAPGTIDTVARSGAGDDALIEKVPMGRRGRPEEIAAAVRFLSSDEASYITGQVLVIDGGASVRHCLIDL
jgi:3-oxoacyl-[acyl-carrier protein] reductase